MSATIFLWASLICFQIGQQQACYPALVGKATPTGIFKVIRKTTTSPGYNGDVLVFSENKTRVFAIHRVWLLNKAQHRQERLDSGNPALRRNITNGCINVTPEVYDKLKFLTEVRIINDAPSKN